MGTAYVCEPDVQSLHAMLVRGRLSASLHDHSTRTVKDVTLCEEAKDCYAVCKRLQLARDTWRVNTSGEDNHR